MKTTPNNYHLQQKPNRKIVICLRTHTKCLNLTRDWTPWLSNLTQTTIKRLHSISIKKLFRKIIMTRRSNLFLILDLIAKISNKRLLDLLCLLSQTNRSFSLMIFLHQHPQQLQQFNNQCKPIRSNRKIHLNKQLLHLTYLILNLSQQFKIDSLCLLWDNNQCNNRQVTNRTICQIKIIIAVISSRCNRC